METKILKILSFVSIIAAYSFHVYLWDGAFYHLTALCFFLLTRLVWKLTEGKWRLVALVMHVTAANNLLDELFFDPLKVDYNEYLTLIVTILIVYYNRDRWMN
jgi:hypothetical protein